MAYYGIVNWDEHYEVDGHGKPWESGQGFRKGPLEYIRVRTRRDWNIRLIELHDLCGEQMWMAIGVFEKLCGIVGCESRPRREGGIIRDSEGAPATDAAICRMLGLEPATWTRVARALCDPRIRWLESVGAEQAAPGPDRQAEGQPPSAPESPGNPGKPGIPEIPEFPLSSQVKSKQSKTNQVKSRGALSLAQMVAPLLAPKAPTARLDGRAPQVLDSTRLEFLYRMRQTLGAQELVEARTVSNFEQWLHENVSSGRAGPELREQALTLAQDCIHGHKPVAVFLARAKKELGYIAPSRRKESAHAELESDGNHLCPR